MIFLVLEGQREAAIRGGRTVASPDLITLCSFLLPAAVSASVLLGGGLTARTSAPQRVERGVQTWDPPGAGTWSFPSHGSFTQAEPLSKFVRTSLIKPRQPVLKDVRDDGDLACTCLWTPPQRDLWIDKPTTRTSIKYVLIL